MITKNKILLRFLVIFVTLITVPFPFNTIPKLDFIEKSVFGLYQKIVPWIGENVLRLKEPITIFQNGSGDKTYDYVLLLLFFVVALTGTTLWSILVKRDGNYEKLNHWFLILVRYYLGYYMIYYGLFKILPIQFGEIAFWRLLQPFGESSPMGLAWTFLAYSKGYNLFMGLAEFVGGILLFHKRTKLLGGLILIPVITNIVAINFFYDIPVKLFSSELLLMAIIIISPDIKRIFDLVILNKSTDSAAIFTKPFTSKKWNQIGIVIKGVFITIILFTTVTFTSELDESRKEKPELYGLYTVQTYVQNNDTIPPLITDKKRWKNIFFEYPKTIQFSRMNNSRYGLTLEIDTIERKLHLTEFNDTTSVHVLDFKKTDSTLTISGIFRMDTIFCKTKRLERNDFRLTSRGFNWINEYPYNR